jgi:DNA-binding SARP family transcriptional activator
MGPAASQWETDVADDPEAWSAMGETRLRFGLLGPLLMTVAGTSVALGTPKQRAVLAMLLINRNRAVGTESLIYAAWDQSPVPAARTSIHSYVSNLRRLLGSAGVDSYKVLASAPQGYRLSIADGDCDLDRFITDKTAGMHAAAAGRFEQASSHLSAALNKWRGPVLDDLRNFAFVEAFATALEDYMLVHITRAEAEIARGRTDAIIGELEALAAKHPYREPLWAKLITAYYVAERRSDALEAYRRLKTVLAEDLGIDPGPTLSALHARILPQERLDTKQAAKTRKKRHGHRAHRFHPQVCCRHVARRCRTARSATSGGHPDRAPFRQRHRCERRRCQQAPGRNHRYRRQFRDYRFEIGQRRASATPATPSQRHPRRW